MYIRIGLLSSSFQQIYLFHIFYFSPLFDRSSSNRISRAKVYIVSHGEEQCTCHGGNASSAINSGIDDARNLVIYR